MGVRSAAPARAGTGRTVVRLAAAALGTAAATAAVWWALPDEAVHSPLWTQVLGWPAVLLVRCDPVQRLIGSGRLDNRVWLRVFLAGTLFAATVAPTGVAFLFPVVTVLVASVHLQWSGARAWRACTTVTLLGTTALEVLVQTGTVPTPLPRSLDLLAAVTTTVVSLALIGNVTVLTAQREADAAVLEAERRSRHDALQHAATHDALTGRLNRTGLQEHVAAHLGTGTGDPLAVVYVDLDDFKPVNDRYGHAAGDLLLRQSADRLAGVLRPQDRVARLGGDEFVVVVAADDPGFVRSVAERVGEVLRAPFDLDGTVVRVSASTGTAVADPGGTGFDELLRRADAAMYAAKTARHARGRAVPGRSRAS